MSKFIFVVIIIGIIFFAFISSFVVMNHGKEEIGWSSYQEIQTWSNNIPELKPIISEYMSDGIINHREDRIIQNEYYRLSMKKTKKNLSGVPD